MLIDTEKRLARTSTDDYELSINLPYDFCPLEHVFGDRLGGVDSGAYTEPCVAVPHVRG
jgi:hypothetical protein